MEPIIELLDKKIFVGNCANMSLTDNKTQELFQGFMPHKTEIKHTIGATIYSLKVYKPEYFQSFNPAAYFDKWATMEVSQIDEIPTGMQSIAFEGGLYAVFHYKGLSTNPSIFNYIFSDWIPNSKYELDNRPHVDVLGDKYKNNDPNSEEDLWIPIKLK